MANRNKNSRQELTIDYVSLALSVRWNTVIYPFEQSKFLALLPEEGYIMTDERLQSPLPFGTWVEANGRIAKKGKAILFTDSDKLVMGIQSTVPDVVVSEFLELEQLLRTQLSFEVLDHAYFHELLAQVLVWSNRSPLETLRSWNLMGGLMDDFSKVIGAGPLSNATLRLIPQEGSALSPDWFDIHIEPSFRSPEKCYRISLVFRNRVRDAVLKRAGTIDKVLTDLVRVLESSHV